MKHPKNGAGYSCSIRLPGELRHRIGWMGAVLCALLAIVVGPSTTAIAQINHVRNPSFEDKTGCPNHTSDPAASPSNQLVYCVDWETPTSQGTPDYLHRCNTYSCPPSGPELRAVGVPSNLFGTQNALTGDAYSGIILGATRTAEYIQGKLVPLQAGRTYRIQFNVSLAEGSSFGLKNLGAYIQQGAYFEPTPNPLVIEPWDVPSHGVLETNAITDETNWVTVTGYYTSQNGGEDRIIIGYFGGSTNYADDQVAVAPGAQCYSDTDPYCYYYIDDVSVVDDGPCGCGPLYHKVTLVPQSSNGSECCMSIQIDTDPYACPLYGIRVRPDYLTNVPFLTLPNSGGDWQVDQSDPHVREWTTSQPLNGGNHADVGTLCVDPVSGIKGIYIDFLDENGVACTGLYELPCVQYCCEHMPDPEIVSVDDGDPQRCCFTLRLSPEGYCGHIYQMMLTPQGGVGIIDASDPNGTPKPSILIQRNPSDPGFDLSLCLEGQQTQDNVVGVKYLDINGNVVCERAFTVRCARDPNNCCDMITSHIESTSTGPGTCCYKVSGTLPVDCNIASIRIKPAAPVTIREPNGAWSSSISFPTYNASTYSHDFCVMSTGTFQGLQIEYLRSNGTVLCVKSYQLMCEEDCCDYFTLSQEAIGSGSSTACCSYLDLNVIEGACDIYGIRIVGGTGGITFNPSQKITVPPPGVPFRIGEWCLGEGTTGSVKVELLGLDGSVVCTKTLTGSCNHSGGGTLRLNSADPGRSSEDPSAESAGAATLVAIPNPTSGMTTLRYRLPVDADVRLEVFDARGARMASIGGGAAKAGTHELSYDTADLPSGEYLVKLSYGKNVVSIPLTIAR